MQFNHFIQIFALCGVLLISVQGCSKKKGAEIPSRTQDASSDPSADGSKKDGSKARVLKFSASLSDKSKLAVQNSTSGKLRVFTILGDSAKSAYDSFLQPEEATTDPDSGTNYQVKSGFGLECRKEKDAKAVQCRFALDADGVVGRSLPAYTWKDYTADLESAKKRVAKATVSYDQIEISISGLDADFNDFVSNKTTSPHLQSLGKGTFKIIFDLSTGAPIKNDTQVGATEAVAVTAVVPQDQPKNTDVAVTPPVVPAAPITPAAEEPAKEEPVVAEPRKTTPKKSQPKNPKTEPKKEVVRGGGQEKPKSRGEGKEPPKARGEDKKKVEKRS